MPESGWLTCGVRMKAGKSSLLVLLDASLQLRETAVYIRQMEETGNRHHPTEQRLSVLWTELGFQLEDLGISKLAKRCQIKGKHWSNPGHFDKEFLEKADVSLDRMERLASEILRELNR